MSVSTTPLPTRIRDDYHATLVAPHASDATLDADLQVYDIRRGPARVARHRRWDAQRDTRLFVPPLTCWTLETVRMTLWELVNFLPGAEAESDEDGSLRQWAQAADIMAAVSVHRSSFQLSVELPKVGVSASFSLGGLTSPLRAALDSLPKEPFPLAAITPPGSA